MFERCAHFLECYTEILETWCYEDLEDEGSASAQADAKEMKGLVARLKELTGQWEHKIGFSGSHNAALIISGMLKDWMVPGAVYWLPKKQRFRVVGEEYEPEPDEFCVGVYLQNAKVEWLAEDFEYVRNLPTVKRSNA